jgi:hypothetical protein
VLPGFWLVYDAQALRQVQSAAENLRGLRPTIRLAKEMGTRLGERQNLL